MVKKKRLRWRGQSAAARGETSAREPQELARGTNHTRACDGRRRARRERPRDDRGWADAHAARAVETSSLADARGRAVPAPFLGRAPGDERLVSKRTRVDTPGATHRRSPDAPADADSGTGRARAGRGGWRRHSKRHASRQNLQAPFAFKVSMIH
jgi:hypothetical protein